MAAIGHALALDEGARRDLSARTIARIGRDFSKQTMCDKTLDVYREVLALPVGE